MPSVTVDVTVDYSNGVTRRVACVTAEGGRPAAALEAAAARAPGFVLDTLVDRAATTRLQAVDGIASDEKGAWVLFVNGDNLGSRVSDEHSFAGRKVALKDGDSLLLKWVAADPGPTGS